MASRSHQYFSLRWNNYQNTMTSVFQQLREDLSFVDVTLSCEHGSLKAHKVVLSACSSYFQKLLLENPCKHPTIILPGDIIFTDLKTIIDFVYRGEIDVTESELQGLLRTAEQLKIKGLCETAENTDDLNDAATATITVSENIQQAVVGNIINTTVPAGQASPGTQQQQQQISTNTAVLTHNISNVNAANSQQIGSTATNSAGQLLATGSSTQQPQIGRKSRVRKRSKSPDLQQQVQNVQQQIQQHPQTILIQNQSQASIVSLQQTSSGSYIPVSGVQTVTTSVAGQHQAVQITSDESNSDKPALSKICKTETASESPTSSASASNNAGSVTTVSAPGTAIVTQIVVARDAKDKNMTSLGMGMNGGILGVPMGFLDFAPEPPAPSATPVTVTEHVDLSCNPNTDTRDLSNPTEALDIDNHLAQHMIQRLDQSPMHPMHHQTGDESNSNLVQHIKSEVIDAKQQQQLQQQQHHQSQQHQLHAQQLSSNQAQQQQTQHQQQQHHLHQQQSSHSHSSHSQHQQAQPHQDISGATVMEIDPSQIKHEPGMIITPEIVNMMTTGHMDMYNSDTSEDSMMIANGSPNDQNEPHYTNLDQPQDIKGQFNGPKTWTQEDMNSALDALKNQNMSLTKASVTYGIPSTTLWQRAHRMGIETPKKEGGTKSWNEDSLNNALEALRSGQISANKASKAFGIPSSTLYKIARREGIRLAAPFNAAPTTWTPEDLERALEAIRAGHTSVQKASAEFGIPTGTLYGRCKREGIELSRSNPTPWSEDAMNEALNSVRIGQMSINQAAIHYNLPYSSLYGRFKRGKYDVANTSSTSINNTSGHTSGSIEIIEHSQENSQQFQYSPSPHQQPQHGGGQSQSQTPQHLTQHVVHIQQSQTHHQQVHGQQQQHIQQQQDVTSSSQVAHSSTSGGQQQQIQQIYHHHSTPERS
ncbi:transcription activator GAGA isoform X2 [Eurosta solidaginis]|uniref:transcription activator GAGA isoform X2 n=1 Tax=Eurosta solidaginis TaxID=178769 RepID=UPI0035313042